MKVLGIDYGTKRIGLAISDETQTLARELDIQNPEQFWQEIPKLIASEQISKIVLGLPVGMSGQDTEKTAEVREFKEQLEQKLKLEVEYMDERLSSAQAEQVTGSSSNIDSMAAQIILQSYLDQHKT